MAISYPDQRTLFIPVTHFLQLIQTYISEPLNNQASKTVVSDKESIKYFFLIYVLYNEERDVLNEIINRMMWQDMFGKKNKKVISLDIFTYDCNGCEKCIKHCRNNVFKMVDNGYCRYAIVQSQDSCNGCNKCLQVCGANAIRLIAEEYVS